MALITTLIPAYKLEHLAEVFLGLARQTCRDFRVIVGDDSPDGAITSLIRDGHFQSLTKGLNLSVVPGPRHARKNHEMLIEQWDRSTPFVHLHMDDDLIYPDFYQAHLKAHESGQYCASVSRRWIAHNDTAPVHGVNLPDFVTSSPLQAVPVGASDVFRSTVPLCYNWLGEFSNMLLSAEGLRHWPRPDTQTINYYGWMDIGFILSAVQHLPVICLRDHLGVFRQHAQQSTRQLGGPVQRVAFMAWASYALQAWQEQRITAAQTVNAIKLTVRECLERFPEGDSQVDRFLEIVHTHGASLPALYDAFKVFWLALLADSVSSSRPPQQAPRPVSPRPPRIRLITA